MGPVAAATLPERLRDVVPLRAALTAYGELYVKLRFRVSSDERATAARTAVLAAFDRLERELDEPRVSGRRRVHGGRPHRRLPLLSARPAT